MKSEDVAKVVAILSVIMFIATLIFDRKFDSGWFCSMLWAYMYATKGE